MLELQQDHDLLRRRFAEAEASKMTFMDELQIKFEARDEAISALIARTTESESLLDKPRGRFEESEASQANLMHEMSEMISTLKSLERAHERLTMGDAQTGALLGEHGRRLAELEVRLENIEKVEGSAPMEYV